MYDLMTDPKKFTLKLLNEAITAERTRLNEALEKAREIAVMVQMEKSGAYKVRNKFRDLIQQVIDINDDYAVRTGGSLLDYSTRQEKLEGIMSSTEERYDPKGPFGAAVEKQVQATGAFKTLAKLNDIENEFKSRIILGDKTEYKDVIKDLKEALKCLR